MNNHAKPKILDLSHGEHDREMFKAILESGYDGPIGILDHRNELDTEIALRANMQGLDWLIRDYNEPGSAGKNLSKRRKLQKNALNEKLNT